MMSEKKALLIMAHGSRREAANTEFCELVERVKVLDGQRYHTVIPCFLELSAPSLDEACEAAIESGCQSVDLYPLFFNAGKHVEKDIPNLIMNAVEKYPQLQCQQLGYFGQFDGLAEMVKRHIELQLDQV